MISCPICARILEPKQFIELLTKLRAHIVNFIESSDKMWFSIYHTIEPAEAAELGKDIVNTIGNIIDDLWNIYKYVIE